jgi:hypothetical protein
LLERLNSLIGLEKVKAEVNQMKAMIAENIRLIAEGDDVEGREFLKSHLEMEVLKKEQEINTLQEQINA